MQSVELRTDEGARLLCRREPTADEQPCRKGADLQFGRKAVAQRLLLLSKRIDLPNGLHNTSRPPAS